MEVEDSLLGRIAVAIEVRVPHQVVEAVVHNCSWSLSFVWVVVGSDSAFVLRLWELELLARRAEREDRMEAAAALSTLLELCFLASAALWVRQCEQELEAL